VPAVIGGITTSLYGLHDTALVYCVAVGVLTATAAVILLARRAAAPAAPEHASPCPELPPGACTVPPCPPNSPPFGPQKIAKQTRTAT
jgi:hypothetical protein